MEVVKRKIALFNVTDIVDHNPGCRATVQGLKEALGVNLMNQFPLGFAYSFFNESNLWFHKNTFEKSYNLFKNDKNILILLKYLDVVIINAEGTIHSNSIGAKTLLAFIRLSKELGKKVYVVNGSFYNLKPSLLKILSCSDVLYVREVESYQYLLKNNINAELVLDCAFLTDFIKTRSIENKEGCIFTPGVIFNHNTYKTEEELKNLIKLQFKEIKKKYTTPVYLKIEARETKYADLWIELGGEVVDATKILIKDLLDILDQFELIISGRYHILLFGLMLNSKLIPLESNTPKILGLLRSFNESNNYLIQDILNNKLNLNNHYHFDISVNQVKNKILSSYSKLFEE
ncbi:polysaccharide pyruvyl transferase family protein [Aequorivita sediminis]|uniref:polysaccharide pyruvyl transferase family protein n=1 Tax=Aequorivita sediminis TaxID=3073653 RepID=UPI0028AEFB3A|nr:polysaccharide pyruvyl transferase family protein [Aequorivita sp. F6058]